MVVLKNQNRRSGIFYLRPLCGFGFFSKSDFSAIFFSHFRSSTDSFLKFSFQYTKLYGMKDSVERCCLLWARRLGTSRKPTRRTATFWYGMMWISPAV